MSDYLEDDTDDADEPLTAEEQAEALAWVRDDAFAMGRERGRDEGRLEVLKSIASENGTTGIVLAFLQKAFNPNQPRDHGKFSTTGGAKDGTVSTENPTGVPLRESRSHTGAPGDTSSTRDPDSHATSLAARIAEVPAHVATRVKDWLTRRYAKLAARYGETGAKAILGAMVLLAPAPIPGSSLIPIAMAEAVLAIRRAVKSEELKKGFDPNEKRDAAGKWTTGGGKRKSTNTKADIKTFAASLGESPRVQRKLISDLVYDFQENNSARSGEEWARQLHDAVMNDEADIFDEAADLRTYDVDPRKGESARAYYARLMEAGVAMPTWEELAADMDAPYTVDDLTAEDLSEEQAVSDARDERADGVKKQWAAAILTHFTGGGTVEKGFDPNEARDESGRWATSGAGGKVEMHHTEHEDAGEDYGLKYANPTRR